MKKWSKKHKNYIQLQVTVKELGDQGVQGSCSIHSFLTNFLLSNLNESLKTEWPAWGEAYTYLTPTCTPAGSEVILTGPDVWPIRRYRWDGQKGLQNLTLLTVLTLGLYCHTLQATFSQIQAKVVITRSKELVTCNPFPLPAHQSALLPLFTAQELVYWARGRQISQFSVSPLSLTTFPSVLQGLSSPKNLLLQPCNNTMP